MFIKMILKHYVSITALCKMNVLYNSIKVNIILKKMKLLFGEFEKLFVFLYYK
jgi:hypothetical protein